MAEIAKDPAAKKAESQAANDQLILDMIGFQHDPLGWVYYSFPWGEGDLKDWDGPDEWQASILAAVGLGLITVGEAIRIAVASGHDIGKSALVAWLILWALSTFEDTRGIITANTETQLRTKTWPELAKWYRMCITKDWFTYTATSIYSNAPGHDKNWRVDAVPWSETNTEAFAGLHNLGKRLILVFDEASAIADKVWEVAEGALTDSNTEIVWCVFGNPTRNSGRFFECFGRFAHRWNTRQIDSRTTKIANKKLIQQWQEDYGEDSDFFKVRVRGMFPAASDRQFISSAIVTPAVDRFLRPEQYSFAPKIITCDPAWYGEDELVIGMRQGLMFRILKVLAQNRDDMEIAGFLAKYEDDEQADAVFIDMGFGTGIYSAGKSIGRDWLLISFAAAAGTKGYLNKRAEMWGLAKDWLKAGGSIPNDTRLISELGWPEYEMRLDGSIQIESKKDMRARGLGSPGRAESLIISFAYPVTPKNRAFSPYNQPQVHFAKHKYNSLEGRG